MNHQNSGRGSCTQRLPAFRQGEQIVRPDTIRIGLDVLGTVSSDSSVRDPRLTISVRA